jgi:hypothetical protein
MPCSVAVGYRRFGGGKRTCVCVCVCVCVRVAANILNKQSWAADKGWSSNLGVGHGANNPSPYKTNLLRNVSKRLGPGLILWHDLSNGKGT